MKNIFQKIQIQKVVKLAPLEKFKKSVKSLIMSKKQMFAQKPKFLDSLTEFMKYHNAFSIGLVLVFLATASVFADEEIRSAVLGEQVVVEKQGIDNAAILNADLDSFDFQLQITGVSEDSENYYIDYGSLVYRRCFFRLLNGRDTI